MSGATAFPPVSWGRRCAAPAGGDWFIKWFSQPPETWLLIWWPSADHSLGLHHQHPGEEVDSWEQSWRTAWQITCSYFHQLQPSASLVGRESSGGSLVGQQLVLVMSLWVTSAAWTSGRQQETWWSTTRVLPRRWSKRFFEHSVFIYDVTNELVYYNLLELCGCVCECVRVCHRRVYELGLND